MEYRIHKRTGDKISVIGLGTSYISDTPQKEAVAALVCAHETALTSRTWQRREPAPSATMGKRFPPAGKR